MKPRPVGIMFHRLHKRGEKPSGQGSIDEDTFEQILLKIGIRNILQPDEWRLKLEAGHLKNSDVCLTFDDGLETHFSIGSPILKKYNLKAFFFIYTKIFENQSDTNEVASYLLAKKFSSFKDYFFQFKKYFNISNSEYLNPNFLSMKEDYEIRFPFYSFEDIFYRFWRNNHLGDSDFDSFISYLLDLFKVENNKIFSEIWISEGQLKKLSNEGHTIGLHSHTHPYSMGKMNREFQNFEYSKNLNIISKLIGKKPDTVAHPLGSYNHETLDILKKMEIKLGFRSDNTMPVSSTLELPRIDGAVLLKEVK